MNRKMLRTGSGVRTPLPVRWGWWITGKSGNAAQTWRGAFLTMCLASFVSGLLTVPACAHPEPVTLVVLDVAPEQVTMNLHVPLSEMELVWGADFSAQLHWQASFKAYLLQHIRPITQTQPWAVTLLELQLETAQQTPSGPVQEIVARLLLTPPAGISTRRFTLNYDVILHQVVTHSALVSLRSDWEGGQATEQEVGIIRVNSATSQVEPLEINLEAGSWWAGFKGMINLGMQHIKEGTDHLLFLLVLLLPAPLVIKGNRWDGFGGSRYSLLRLLKIVTAFTLGHSLTLLCGALGWLRLPQQPVEVLIAFSILVSALHALRPLFPGKELYIALGFGLVHGLAFATVLSDLRLSAGPLALSILGFNLGIELMQLFVIAITMPWLVLLSLTPLYRWVRRSCAVFAALAALGWMATRLTGQSNTIERTLATLTTFAPLAILGLAVLAVPAYLFSAKARADEPDATTTELELLKQQSSKV